MPQDVHSGQSDSGVWSFSLFNGGVHTGSTEATDHAHKPGDGEWNGKDSTDKSDGQHHHTNLDASNPELSKPKDVSASKKTESSEKTVSKAATKPPAPGDGSETTASPLDVQFTHDFDSLVKTALTASSQNPDQFAEDTELANYYLDNPDAQVPPQDAAIKAIVVNAQQKAAAQVKKENPGVTWTPPQGNPKQFQTIYHNAFMNAMKTLQNSQKPPLSATAMAQLQFAFFNPSLVDSKTLNSPNMQELQSLVTTNLSSSGYAVPSNFKPDNTTYNNMLASDYSANFNKQLAQYAKANGLTTKQQNELRVMFYAPDLPVADQAKLAPMLTAITQQAIAQTRTQDGVPASVPAAWTPTQPASTETNFKNTLQMNFQINNATNLQNATLNGVALTPAQQAQVTQLMNDPTNTTGIPASFLPQARQLATQILSQSTSQTQATYGLSSWTPAPGAASFNGPVIVKNALVYNNELQAVVKKIASQVPPGPQQPDMLNLLQMISNALSQLQNSVYDMETAQAQRSTNTTKAQDQTMKDSISIHEAQQAAMQAQEDAMQAQQAKADKTQSIMKIMGPVMIAVAVLATVVTLGLDSEATVPMIAMTITMMAVTVNDQEDPKFQLMSTVMNGAGSAMKSMLTDMGITDPKVLEAADIMAKVYVLLLVVTACLMTGGGGATDAADAAANISVDAADGAEAGAEAADTADVAVSSGSEGGAAAGDTGASVSATLEDSSEFGLQDIGALFKEADAEASNAADEVEGVVQDVNKLKAELEEAEQSAESGAEAAGKGASSAAKSAGSDDEWGLEDVGGLFQESGGDSNVSADLEDTSAAGKDAEAAGKNAKTLTSAQKSAQVRMAFAKALAMGTFAQWYGSAGLSKQLISDFGGSQSQAALGGMIMDGAVQIIAMAGAAYTISQNADVIVASASKNVNEAEQALKELEQAATDLKEFRITQGEPGELTTSEEISTSLSKAYQKIRLSINESVIESFTGVSRTTGEETNMSETTLVNFMRGSMDVTNASLGMEKAQLDVDLANDQAAIAKTDAASKAQAVMFQTDISQLGQMVSQILQILGSLESWNSSIGDTQQNLWKDYRFNFQG